MYRRRFGPGEAAFMIGVPLAWAVLLMFHPKGDGTRIYRDIQDQVTAMMAVHVGMMLFIPLLAVAVFLLLRGIEGTAAQISRVAIIVFVVFFSAWETLQGTANAILVNAVNGLPEGEQATGATVIQDFAEHPLARDLGVFATVGSLAVFTAMIAAGIALRRHAGAPAAVPVLLGLCGLLIGAHPPPLGPIALVCFAAAVFLCWRVEPATVAPVRPAQPSSA